jgi:hypothetical protein
VGTVYPPQMNRTIARAVSLSMLLVAGCNDRRTTPANTAGVDAPVPTVLVADASAAAPPNPTVVQGKEDRGVTYCSAFSGNEQENCYLRVATVTRQDAYCGRAGTLRAICLAAVARMTGDGGHCKGLGAPREVFECFMAATILAPSADHCAPLRNVAGLKALCVQDANNSDCAMWDSADAAKLSAVCAAVSSNDLAAVRSIRSNESTALHMLAIRRKDPSLCPVGYSGRTAVPDERCLADVGAAKKDRATCAMLKRGARAGVSYEFCISASANGDPKACTLLTDGSPEQQNLARKICAAAAATKCPDTGLQDCVTHFVMSATDANLCRSAPGFPDQTCLLTVALNTRKRDACEGLLQPAMKTACEALTAP